MSVQRIIPVLLHNQGRLVLSRGFQVHQDIGCADHILDRLKSWDVDELVILDISPHWSDRDKGELFNDFLTCIEKISRNCFTPLAVGGGIKSLDHMHRLIQGGADRVVVNSAVSDNIDLITQGAKTYGAQAMVACIDARPEEGGYNCYTHAGAQSLNMTPEDLAQKLQISGAGEIFLQSIDRNGRANGYDEVLIRSVVQSCDLPVIACGGAGSWDDFSVALKAGAKGVAAANIFAFQELSYRKAKDACLEHDLEIRPGTLGIDYAARRHARDLENKFGAADMDLWRDLGAAGFMGEE